MVRAPAVTWTGFETLIGCGTFNVGGLPAGLDLDVHQRLLPGYHVPVRRALKASHINKNRVLHLRYETRALGFLLHEP